MVDLQISERQRLKENDDDDDDENDHSQTKDFKTLKEERNDESCSLSETRLIRTFISPFKKIP